MAGWTNRGKNLVLDYYFRRQGTLPTSFFVALVTSAQAPGPTTNTLGDLTEIAAGNGYTAGGLEISPNTTDFPDMSEDDTNHKAILKLKDIVHTASGGSLPASGSGARYAVLLGPHATPASREVFAYWSLTTDRSVTIGNPLTLQDCEIDLTE